MPKRSDTTKDLFLIEALRLFSKNGYEAVSVSQIADAVGCSAPALWYYIHINTRGTRIWTTLHYNAMTFFCVSGFKLFSYLIFFAMLLLFSTSTYQFEDTTHKGGYVCNVFIQY